MRAISTDAYFLLVDKPPGVTSHDAVAIVRRAFGMQKAGHTGTLDPFATGLLVVLGGRGTRLIPYVPGDPKEYVATIRFGTQTDTDDATGEMLREMQPPSRDAIDLALPALTGEIQQVPPAFSAKHVDGGRAYAVARRGDSPRLAPSRVRVDSWEIVDWADDTLRARIRCGGGTYIRALARDLGLLAGSLAHLAALERTRSGPFAVDDAWSLDEVRSGAAVPRPLLDALGAMAVHVLNADDARRVSHGMRVGAAAPGEVAAPVALIGDDGTLLAIASRRLDEWQPEVVLAPA